MPQSSELCWGGAEVAQPHKISSPGVSISLLGCEIGIPPCLWGQPGAGRGREGRAATFVTLSPCWEERCSYISWGEENFGAEVGSTCPRVGEIGSESWEFSERWKLNISWLGRVFRGFSFQFQLKEKKNQNSTDPESWAASVCVTAGF